MKWPICIECEQEISAVDNFGTDENPMCYGCYIDE
jgi:hypothetical protein